MIFSDLLGRRVLIVEDDYHQATHLTLGLEDQGSDVVGPFPDLKGGVAAVGALQIDAAILDVRLGGDTVFYLADRLKSRGIPFMFVTGYDRSDIPERFAEVRCLLKPVDLEEMAVALAITFTEHGQVPDRPSN